MGHSPRERHHRSAKLVVARLRHLQKYKSAQERTFKTALAELRKLQTERLAMTQTGELAQAQISANAPVAAPPAPMRPPQLLLLSS